MARRNQMLKGYTPSSDSSETPRDPQIQFAEPDPAAIRLHAFSTHFSGGIDAIVTDLRPPPRFSDKLLLNIALRNGPSYESSVQWVIADRHIENKAQEQAALVGKPLAPTDSLGLDGFVRRYQGADIYYSPQTGAHEVHGDIRAKYNALGGPNSILKLPVTDELGTPDGIGRFNHFEGGSIYWTLNTGPMLVHSAVRDLWARQGWERGALGYPVADQHRKVFVDQANATPAYWTVFQNGAIYSLGNQAAPALVAELTPPEVAGFVRKLFDKALHDEDNDLGIEGGVNILNVSDWRFGFWASGPRQVTFEINGFYSAGLPLIADPTFHLELTFEFGLTWAPSFTEPVDKTFVIHLTHLLVSASGVESEKLHDRLRSGILDKFKEPFPVATIPAQEARLITMIVTAAGGIQFLLEPDILNPSFTLHRFMFQQELDTLVSE